MEEIKRDFYAAMCKAEGWSVRTLRERKNSMLFERTAISRKPEETIKNDVELLMAQDKMTLDMFYREPYILDFLGLKDTYSEKDLENAILSELERFILEMGITHHSKTNLDACLKFFYNKMKYAADMAGERRSSCTERGLSK